MLQLSGRMSTIRSLLLKAAGASSNAVAISTIDLRHKALDMIRVALRDQKLMPNIPP
jgi:hypothetical protein